MEVQSPLNSTDSRGSADSSLSQGARVVETRTGTSALMSSGSIALFSYLTPQVERVPWYRTIMRHFLLRNREYRYQLTAQEILATVQDELDQNYTLESCKSDLERLVTWGNLTTLYDTSRVTSIADFRSPVLLYQAAPEAIEIEVFLSEHMRVGASEGGLRQGDLPKLWAKLEELEHWLVEGPATYTPERRQEIAEAWRDAFQTWEKVTNDAAQYLGSMNRSVQQSVTLDAFLSYKSAVVNYVQNFAQQLALYSQRIRFLLHEWMQTQRFSELIELVSSAPPPTQALTSQHDMQQMWRKDVEKQVTALVYWFDQDSNVEMFRKAARNAVDMVVHRAHTLSAAMRPHTDYVTMLQNLGSQLLQVEDLEAAQQVFVAAFACTTPIHLPEGMTGSPSAAEQFGERKTWQRPATVTRTLRPISRGNIERSAEPVMRTNTSELYNIRVQYEAGQAAQRNRLKKLFATALLDLGTLESITPEDRTLLNEIIDGCLGNVHLEYYAPDGSIVRLLNSDERNYIALSAQDGQLLLPRYKLLREEHAAAS